MAKPTSQPVKETAVALLVKQVALPKKAHQIRLAGAGNSRPSALAAPFQKPAFNWGTPPAAGSQLLPGNEAVVITTNDPLHAAIFTDKNATGVQLSQVWLFSGSPDTSIIRVAPGGTPNLAGDLFCSTPAAGAKAWHGPRLYPWLHKGKYYMWCDASTTPGAANNISVFTGPTVPMAAGDAITVTFYRLNEGDELQVQSTHIAGPVAINTAVVVFNLTAADWWRVDITGDDENATALLELVINNSATSEILVHNALPDLSEREMNSIQGIRVIGSASHVINGVNDNNATGFWVADQPEGSVMYTTYLRGAAGANGFQALASQQGNETMEFKKFNPYTFVTPEDADDWQFVHPFSFNSSKQVTNTINRQGEDFHYTIIYFQVGGATAGAADPARANTLLEFFYGVEYTSDGLWKNLEPSPVTEDDCAAAVKILASMENITHNPGFKEIMATIGKYVRLSAPVLALLGPYGKAASIAATGIGEGIGMVFPSKSRTKKTARPEEESAGDEARAGRFQKVEELRS